MNRFLDALYCYCYLFCKNKVWFIHEDYSLFAWLLSAISTSIILYMYLLLYLTVFGYPSLLTVNHESGMPNLAEPITAFGFFILVAVIQAIHLLKNRRYKVLIFNLMERKERLSNLEAWIGRAYKIALIGPLFILLVFSLFDLIKDM